MSKMPKYTLYIWYSWPGFCGWCGWLPSLTTEMFKKAVEMRESYQKAGFCTALVRNRETAE